MIKIGELTNESLRDSSSFTNWFVGDLIAVLLLALNPLLLTALIVYAVVSPIKWGNNDPLLYFIGYLSCCYILMKKNEDEFCNSGTIPEKMYFFFFPLVLLWMCLITFQTKELFDSELQFSNEESSREWYDI